MIEERVWYIYKIGKVSNQLSEYSVSKHSCLVGGVLIILNFVANGGGGTAANSLAFRLSDCYSNTIRYVPIWEMEA